MSCLIHRHTRLVPRMNFQSAPDAFAKGCVPEPLCERPATAFSAEHCWFWFPSSLLVFDGLQLNDSQWLIHLPAAK